MSIDIVKKFRRSICKAVGHDWHQVYPNNVCLRCKKKENLIWSLKEPEFVGCFPKREDIPVKSSSDEPTVGDIKYDMEHQAIMLYDGKNWIVCK